MQHLDDGVIHALLDGELSAEEADALNEHVRYCSACADRLAEERLIQSEAERMIAELDAPAPAAAAGLMTPDLGAERLQPESLEPPLAIAPDEPRSSGPPVVLIPDREFERSRVPRMLGWAATLAVAAGAGYFASVARQPARTPVQLPEIGVPDAASAGGYLVDSSAGFSDSLAMAKTVAPSDSAVGAAFAPAESQAAAAMDSAPLVVEESESEREPQADAAAPPPAPAVARDETAARREEADQPAQRQAAPAPAPARPARESNQAARPAASAPSSLEEQAQLRMRIGLDETQRMLGSPLHVIDGLQQQMVGLVDGRLVQGANPNAPVVRVVYLDDQRRPIYLDQQRLDNTRRQMGLARDTTPPDWVVGDVWLSLKGSLSAAELTALAQRVR